MNEYEAKQEARREQYEQLARKNNAEARSRQGEAMKQLSIIPPGQPILVGHHSEAGHRAHLKRIDNHFRKASEATDKAEYYEQKAKGVGTGGISSDDPEAIQKLRDKLAGMEASQEHMKRINKIHRAYKKDPASLDKHELTDKERELITTYEPEYSWIPSPYAPYQMQNNNGNMKRVRDRIKRLESLATLDTTTKEHGEIEIVCNTEANRVQILFPGKSSEAVRKQLKRYGFRWAPSNKAWQRHLTNAAKSYAGFVIEYITNDLGGEWE